MVVVLNEEQVSILKHAVADHQGMFCGDSTDMDFLVEEGYMKYEGKKSFVPEGYYSITPEGLAKLSLR